MGLANCLRQQGQLESAERHFLRCLGLCETHMGPRAPATGVALNNIAGLYRTQERFPEAERAYEVIPPHGSLFAHAQAIAWVNRWHATHQECTERC